MRHELAPVKNVRRLMECVDILRERPVGMPGLGLIFGNTGFGKTSATAKLGSDTHGIYVRSCAVWTPRSMLDAICDELQIEPAGSCGATVKRVVARMVERQRPLLIDEADYLLTRKLLLETLRDLHDLSEIPILLIGMEDFRRKISILPQLAGRISQWVEFGPADQEDARVLADTVCEVQVEDDLLDELRTQTGGSMRGMTIGLSHIEAMAKKRRLSSVSRDAWGDKPLTLKAVPARAA